MAEYKDRTGETRINNFGGKMTIIEYENYHNITVKFEEGNYTVKTTYKQFEIGGIKSPYDRTVFGHGYLGIGKYNVKKGFRYKDVKSYNVWIEMLRRCYYEAFQDKFPSYIGCTVCEEWHNYQNFARWFDENYYEIQDKKMCLDKDILIKGNKIYSPETCVFAPNEINCLFLKKDSMRGKYPIGVTFHRIDKKYRAKCHNGKGSIVDLGGFDTSEQAFITYKNFKENFIKETAEKYKNLIPEKLYKALYQYNVCITD